MNFWVKQSLLVKFRCKRANSKYFWRLFLEKRIQIWKFVYSLKKKALLKCNCHTISCIYLKCTFCEVLTYLCICETFTTNKMINIPFCTRNFFIPLFNPFLLLFPILYHLCHLPSVPRQPLVCFLSPYIRFFKIVSDLVNMLNYIPAYIIWYCLL